MRRPGRAARAVLVAMLATMLTSAAGCGGTGEEPVDDALTSSLDQPFALVDHDRRRYVVGHGVVLEVPEGWTGYEPERDSVDGTTHEWAVGLPVREGSFPSGLQFSMGRPGAGPELATLTGAARELAELSPGFELIDEGAADVPGARQAAYLRFLRDFEYEGQEVRLEQVTLMVEVAQDSTSTVRFLAPEGEWEDQMAEVFDSVTVAPDEG